MPRTAEGFVNGVVAIAKELGYLVAFNKSGQQQIDFGNKKLHEGHLNLLYPKILEPDANIKTLIDSVAPGRPCTHKPMREIVQLMNSRDH